ncbi:MAG: hypothetical protein A2Y10_02865 [Planctomycetes bacterium GWF2_41_51]|nr:MAG: hypothetical protein A2Y10_02865 [Planctomycetes bacterium GWF2_41_51]HBG27492.1 hypothetical protein [Phycisphaerales bacterium]
MEAKFFDSIYGGDSANGVKLCMGITDGDFWARPTGVQVLYKGTEIDNVDFRAIVDSANIAEDNFEIICGQPLSRFLYIVRRVNCCGIEEKTVNAVLRVEFDSQGNLIEYGCNKIIDVSAHQADGDKVSLRWFYHAIHQAKKIKSFFIYSDNGNGTIDYQDPIGIVEYTGCKFYQFITNSLSGNHYKFCIRAVADDSVSEFYNEIKIGLNRQSPNEVQLICQTM